MAQNLADCVVEVEGAVVGPVGEAEEAEEVAVPLGPNCISVTG